MSASAAVALCVILYAAGILKVMPQSDRETPARWVDRGPFVWASTMGGLLGIGFTTRIGFWSWYFIPVLAFGSGSPIFGGLMWGIYGGLRSLWPIVIFRARLPLADRLLGGYGAAKLFDILASSLVAGVLVTITL